ncbi:hypothetical protein K440DRAFT_362601 [Wilcoxina mikolae CBS 423.85]|nr:hypothetical protein K440DRAFT_362601 [Wilcoxina mikolae CBS 423.85]
MLLDDPRFKSAGMLIDFDMAVKYNSQSSGASERTGTFNFMAIGILKGTAVMHTPLHDLESFLYVLLYLGTKYENGSLRSISHHRERLFRSPSRTAVYMETTGYTKAELMRSQGFHACVLPDLGGGFGKRLGKMLREMRHILGPHMHPPPPPDRDTDLDSDSDVPLDMLHDPINEDSYQTTYDKFIAALDKRIASLRGR